MPGKAASRRPMSILSLRAEVFIAVSQMEAELTKTAAAFSMIRRVLASMDRSFCLNRMTVFVSGSARVKFMNLPDAKSGQSSMVTIPSKDYDRLRALAVEAEEDAAAAGLIARAPRACRRPRGPYPACGRRSPRRRRKSRQGHSPMAQAYAAAIGRRRRHCAPDAEPAASSRPENSRPQPRHRIG